MNKSLQISILTEELTVARALLRIKEAELVKARDELELARNNKSISGSIFVDDKFWNDWTKVARGIEDVPIEYNKLINDNFWEMIEGSEKSKEKS